MTVYNKLLTEQHLEFVSLKGGCTGSAQSIHVKVHIVGNHMSLLKYTEQLYKTCYFGPLDKSGLRISTKYMLYVSFKHGQTGG